MVWSLDDFCQNEWSRQIKEDWSLLPDSSQAFLRSLELPIVHPFCHAPQEFVVDGVPPMGPLIPAEEHHWDWMVTLGYQILPALIAMAELWLRLFAIVIAPVGVLYMLYREISEWNKSTVESTNRFCAGMILTVAASLVLLTDNLYILEFGPFWGLGLFVTSAALAWKRVYSNANMTKTLLALSLIKVVTACLIYHPEFGVSFGDPHELVQNVTQGLYYSPHSELVQRIIDVWPTERRSYSEDATPWMPSGDSRTGLPFLLNKNVPRPDFQRLWLETHDSEYLALDIAMPHGGHDHNGTKPLYLVLHGLNGGSQEDYVKEFAHRRIAEGATVVVMIARGLMDTPIKGWDIFHGARVADVHTTAKALRKVLATEQILAGVGYSMGAMILPNYVARSGPDCALDAAVAVSGGLDMRFGYNYHRVHRLWHPMLTQELRDAFMTVKWGERARARVPEEDLKQTMRATNLLRFDETFSVQYNGFGTVHNYYSEMSAMGDIPMSAYKTESALPATARIHDIRIPMAIISALDDPLVSWRCVAANNGLMHPSTLPGQVRSGNLVLLLTKAGGHVGWPLGLAPQIRKWEWMNDASSTFAESVQHATTNGPGGDTEEAQRSAEAMEEKGKSRQVDDHDEL